MIIIMIIIIPTGRVVEGQAVINDVIGTYVESVVPKRGDPVIPGR